jgi:hypothetical protein
MQKDGNSPRGCGALYSFLYVYCLGTIAFIYLDFFPHIQGYMSILTLEASFSIIAQTLRVLVLNSPGVVCLDLAKSFVMIAEGGKAVTIDGLNSGLPQPLEDESKSSAWKAYWVSEDDPMFGQPLTRYDVSRESLHTPHLQNAP